jgi:2-polyprenyl-3-methyl-5-hydroxy-6-metoxy-1,4-benzoquinol methylase
MQVDERLHRVAAAANDMVYDRKDAKTYIEGAPHIKHAVLRDLYSRLLVDVYDQAASHTETPHILDLGAGEGSVTLAFLELGARVTAVDISRHQCDNLQAKCHRHADRLDVRCEDVGDVMKDRSQLYDIVATNSFLHHIPDYLGLIEQSLGVLKPGGQFFSFQDPMRYDSLSWFTHKFKNFAYFTWRVSRGDVIGGMKRRLRRSRGIYYDDAAEDHAEYHAMRNGVDQDAIRKLFESRNFDCRIVAYFSTQSSFFQPIGTALGMKNLFGVIAKSREPAGPRDLAH